MSHSPGQAEMFAPGSNPALARAKREHCEWCNAPLKGKQERFCSSRCNTAWYDAAFPRMNRGPEGPREGTIRDAILGYLADGEWRTKAEIAFHVRAHEHSVGSRLSELRRKGFRIESDAPNGCSRRSHRFRLVLG